MATQVFDSVGNAHPLADIALEPLQFRLTEAPHPGATAVGNYWLSHCPRLPITKVTDQAGQPAGLLLGFPIDLARARATRGTWVLPAGADAHTDDGRHRALLALGGTFLWICLSDGCARIYPDAGTQVSCVWDAATGSAGATTRAILEETDYLTRFDHALFAHLRTEGGGWFPAGLTAHSGVTRLLPNHYLDLTTWSAHRFDLAPMVPYHDIDACVDGVIADVQAQIGALVKQPRRCAVALTAGYQTRALLACARDWIDQISFVTVAGTGRQNADAVIASLIAAEQVLTHQVLPRVEATRQQQETYLRRGGHCVAHSNMRWHTSLAPLTNDHLYIGGVGGAVGQVDADADGVSAESLLGGLGMASTDKIARHMRLWFSEVAHMPRTQIQSLAYLENFVGPAAMAATCANPGMQRFAPFLTHRNMAVMQSLPPALRHENKLAKEIVARLWPGLERYPYNTPGLRGQRSDLADRSGATALNQRAS